MRLAFFSGIIFVIFILKSFSTKAQAYEPMLGILNEWHVTSCFGSCNTFAYFTDGDTTVGGKNYKILDGYHYASRTFLLREDLQERQVFLMKISPTKIDEWLMYDFSMEVGDSIELFNPVSPYPLIAGFYELDSIVSRPLEDSQFYRYFYLSPTSSNVDSDERPVWVESVGSLSLINGPGSTPDFNGGGELSCYFKDDESRYLNMDSIQSCEQEHFLTLGELTNETEFKVFPNPSTNSFTISSQQKELKRAEITDVKGDKILQLNFNQNEIIYHNLEPGIYYIKLIGDSFTSEPHKFVVIK